MLKFEEQNFENKIFIIFIVKVNQSNNFFNAEKLNIFPEFEKYIIYMNSICDIFCPLEIYKDTFRIIKI